MIEAVVRHDEAAAVVLEALVTKFRAGQEEINDMMKVKGQSLLDVATIMIPYVTEMAELVLQQELVAYNALQPEAKQFDFAAAAASAGPAPPCNLIAFLQRCEKLATTTRNEKLQGLIDEFGTLFLPISNINRHLVGLPPFAPPKEDVEATYNEVEQSTVRAVRATGATSKAKPTAGKRK